MNTRKTGVAATVIGAIASVALLVYVGTRAGSNKTQPVVMILIAIWVLSPFVILLAAKSLSKSWSDTTRAALYAMMIVIPVISLIVYVWAATGPLRPKAAAPFVGTPPVSWLLITLVLSFAAFIGRRRPAS